MDYIHKSLNEIKKKEDSDLILSVLWDVGKYEDMDDITNISLNPDNIEYDDRGNTFLINESIDENACDNDFLEMYKALCGALLQRKYKYIDYIEGGQSLLKKDQFLNRIYEANTVSAIRELLRDEHVEIIEHNKTKKKQVNKVMYYILVVCLGITILLSVFLGAYYIKDYFFIDKRNQAFISSYESFLAKNYVKVIDDLAFVDIKYMNSMEKNILALAYIRTENLTDEQKENIINDLSVRNLEKLYDYWIYLGRSDFSSSQNMAMQLSDDELLLYSYMKEREYLKNNTSIDGQEKADRLSELEDYIERYKNDFEKSTSQSNTIDMH